MSDFTKLPSPCTFRADHYREYSRSSIGSVPVPDVLLYLKPVGEEDFTRFPVMFIADSGADVTILPKWNARDLEISLDGVEPVVGAVAAQVRRTSTTQILGGKLRRGSVASGRRSRCGFSPVITRVTRCSAARGRSTHWSWSSSRADASCTHEEREKRIVE